MSKLLRRFADDAVIYAHQLNLLNDTVLLVRLSESDLADHSFLDERIYRPDMDYEWAPWAEFESACGALPDQTPGYIFHIGHCGSTLVSRLVAAATDTNALREPLPLRSFAIDVAENLAGLLGRERVIGRLRLFERAWARGARTTIVKATSICTNLIDAVADAAPVLFVFQKVETHLAVILAGENALQDLRGFGQIRYRRLREFDDDLPPLAAMSIGELAAMTWLSETSSANRGLSERAALRLDFDEFLAAPAEQLAAICGHLGLSATAQACDEVVTGPIMQKYSKAPEHDYGPQLRQDVIDDSRRRNEQEISRGLELIERFSSTTCGADWS